VAPPLPVAHGFNLRDLDQLARDVVSNSRSWWAGADRDDLYDAAWHGIVEALYTAEQAPTRIALMDAGRRAVDTDVRDTRRHHGARRGADRTGERHALYWAWHGRTAPSPENGIVERIAAEQILPTLTPRQRAALEALVEAGDYEPAAHLLGVSVRGLRAMLSQGRRRFRALWHEGETPSGHWGCDRRAEAVNGVVGGRSLGRRLRRRAARAATGGEAA